MVDLAADLNADCHSSTVDRGALELSLREQGDDYFRHVTESCPHLFATIPYFVTAAQVSQMREIVAAVERVVSRPAWRVAVLPAGVASDIPRAKGVFFGYDFHLNAGGAHLIEINTNAGGAFLNHLLLQSQRDVLQRGEKAAQENLAQIFVDMFRNEWRLERGDAPLQSIAIVDEEPQQQYLYPEFLLAQRIFDSAGIKTCIVDPAELTVRADGVFFGELKIDVIYNRLTDFHLEQYETLNIVFNNMKLAVITPHPLSYALYANKYNLVNLTRVDILQEMGVAESDIAVLQTGIPPTRVVLAEDSESWWDQRKQWFFKPASGYGSKGAYRGANLTRRVFAEIVQGNYVAQRLALPGERAVCGEGGEPAVLKSDIRCYVYDGKVQFIAARLYQGQTTNFRTPNGGFAQVRIVG